MSPVLWVIIGIIACLFSASALMIVAAVKLAQRKPENLPDPYEARQRIMCDARTPEVRKQFRSTVFPSTKRA